MAHLTKWLFFNLTFGAVPYALTVALNQLQHPGSPLLHPSSEVPSIAVVATSSALGELWDEHPWEYPRPRSRSRWQLVLLVGVLLSSLLYGAYVYHSLMSPGREYGNECATVADLAVRPRRLPREIGELVSGWGPICTRWATVQARFFECSLWLTGVCVLAGTAAIHWCRTRRR